MTTTTQTAGTPATITNIQDAATARWLGRVLDAARARAQAEPEADTLARIRARVLGAEAPRRERPSIAA